MKTLTAFLLFLFLFSSCDLESIFPNTLKDPVIQHKSSKRGVSFSYKYEQDIIVLSEGISWSYNWAISQSSEFDEIVNANKIDFCPMAWNGFNELELREYIARNPQCEYLLGFNEPNLVEQANMTPQKAAQRWVALQEISEELNLKLISPAMNYGTLAGYSDPIVWLDEFFELVPLSDVHGIAVHCYMSSAPAMKSYLERFKKYDKPIWLTEFCAWDQNVSPESQQKYMSDAINYLESDPDVFRYAWFIPRGSGSELNFPYMYLLKNSTISELTTLGEMFVGMSSQDKEIYYVEEQNIEAEHYSSLSIAAGVGQPGWVNGPKVRITSEAPNESLELYNFFAGQWVEYQIEVDKSKEYMLEMRYASFVDSDIEIFIDGALNTSYILESTQEEFIWDTAEIPISLDEGKQTLRIVQNDGTFSLNWLKFRED